jgi:hypothetical protein
VSLLCGVRGPDLSSSFTKHLLVNRFLLELSEFAVWCEGPGPPL